jgi:hypothetical protein
MQSLLVSSVDVHQSQRDILAERGICEAQWDGRAVTVRIYDGSDEGWFDSGESRADKLLYMKSLRHPNIVKFYGLCSCDGIEEQLLVFEHCSWEASSLAMRLQGSTAVSVHPLTYKQIIDISCDVLSGLRYLNSKDHPLMSGLHCLTANSILLLPDGSAKIKDISVGVLQDVEVNRNSSFSLPRCEHYCIFSTANLLLEMLTGHSSDSVDLDQYNQRVEKVGNSHPLYSVLKRSMEPPPNCPSSAEFSAVLESQKYSQLYFGSLRANDTAGRISQLEAGLVRNHFMVFKLKENVAQLQHRIDTMIVEHREETTTLRQQINMLSEQNKLLRQCCSIGDRLNHTKLDLSSSFHGIPSSSDILEHDYNGFESGYETANNIETMQKTTISDKGSVLGQESGLPKDDDWDKNKVTRRSSAPGSTFRVRRNTPVSVDPPSVDAFTTGRLGRRTASTAPNVISPLVTENNSSHMHPFSEVQAQLDGIIVDLDEIDTASSPPVLNGISGQHDLPTEDGLSLDVANENQVNGVQLSATPASEQLVEEVVESSLSQQSSDSGPSTPHSLPDERDTVHRFLNRIQRQFNSLESNRGHSDKQSQGSSRPHSIHELHTSAQIATSNSAVAQSEEQASAQGNNNDSNSITVLDVGEETGIAELSLTASPTPTRQSRTKPSSPCDSPVTSDHLPPMDEAPPPYEHVLVQPQQRSSNSVQGYPLANIGE